MLQVLWNQGLCSFWELAPKWSEKKNWTEYLSYSCISSVQSQPKWLIPFCFQTYDSLFLIVNHAPGWLKKRNTKKNRDQHWLDEAWLARSDWSLREAAKRETGDKREHELLRGSTQWLTLPASCQPPRSRLRLSNCLPRWAPTGSLPGCSHAKWLEMGGMIRCWVRPEGNLPDNLATSSSESLTGCNYRWKSLCARCFKQDGNRTNSVS